MRRIRYVILIATCLLLLNGCALLESRVYTETVTDTEVIYSDRGTVKREWMKAFEKMVE